MFTLNLKLRYSLPRYISLLLFVVSIFLFPTFAVAQEVKLQCTQIEVYTKPGCPHCARAKQHLALLQTQYPELELKINDIQYPDVLVQFKALNRQLDISRPGVPMFMVCGRFSVGYDDQHTPKWLAQELLGEQSSSLNKVTLPLFGEIALSELGLPLFTVAIGLVDGFNPCAMWVLLFLLSLLMHLHDSKKIAVIAGVFVITSGVVYFGFMAAWLNIFLMLGFSRNIQWILGGIGIIIAIVNLKDFFAFKQGVSFSIPETSKPDIYARVRKVVQAENLWVAIPGVITIAVLVNFLELLCTAGLPALYTKILVDQALPNIHYYAYLILYNIAYIFDDAVMVTLAILGVSLAKLDVQQGRWLKLISGAVMLLLALILIVEPNYF